MVLIYVYYCTEFDKQIDETDSMGWYAIAILTEHLLGKKFPSERESNKREDKMKTKIAFTTRLKKCQSVLIKIMHRTHKKDKNIIYYRLIVMACLLECFKNYTFF